MADKTYDVIIAGGGHHGLITACYLQRAGMKTEGYLSYSPSWEAR